MTWAAWREAFAAATLGEVAAAAALLIGAAFSLIAAIGVVRFKDVFMRMHASTKAGTLGPGLALLGAAVGFYEAGAAARAAGAFALLLLTAPVAAHAIGRAAYVAGARLSARTWIDERKGADGVIAKRRTEESR
ncbi:monovalent cation/H(+) antiporter subunit G [Rubrimonas cliftonensis]|uniref:Multisubunit sodium/proton antiporter, MrpG subunit n=1 Tax=Rubrimonas cliftonensis TaxID=89524 RepID=A0A1H4D3V8_9RHOB|nr:monovalent cation/H(+) antiporter subunit G [Rubrimonas cliftonensis]SEA67268.1 multisubunit sodium/proton antiporter, MrpG subunit [Rubrimonas cliftonensis]